jgi:hypothetical protein
MIKTRGRVVGLDVHPDNFAGAVVEGTDPASAQVLSSSTRVELGQLEQCGRCVTAGEKTRWYWRPVATRLRWRRACVRSAERSRSWTVIVPARWQSLLC